MAGCMWSRYLAAVDYEPKETWDKVNKRQRVRQKAELALKQNPRKRFDDQRMKGLTRRKVVSWLIALLNLSVFVFSFVP